MAAYAAPLVRAVDLSTGRAMCTPAQRGERECGEGNLNLYVGAPFGVDTCLVAPGSDTDLRTAVSESASWADAMLAAIASSGDSG